MNTLQHFKIADAIGQFAITPALYIGLNATHLLNQDDSVGFDLLACFFFGVGAWQATSCLLWAFITIKHRPSTSRKIYSWTLFVLCIWAFLAAFAQGKDASEDVGFSLLFVLFFLGPLMSAWYFALTVAEILSMAKEKSQQSKDSGLSSPAAPASSAPKPGSC